MNNDELNEFLADNLNICSCQRYPDKINFALHKILKLYKEYGIEFTEHASEEQILIIALLDGNTSGIVSHGSNIEYPIIDEENPFWVEVENEENFI